jgi:hypothetical protein
MPKIIPKKTFQLFVMFLLLSSVLLAGYWMATNSGLYRLLAGWIGGSPLQRGLSALLTLLFNLLGVAILTLLLRPFVQGLTPLKAGFQKDLKLLKAPGSLQEKLAAAQWDETEKDPDTAQMQAKFVAVALITLGLAFGIIAIAAHWMLGNQVLDLQAQLLLVGIGLLITGVWRLMRAGKA